MQKSSLVSFLILLCSHGCPNVAFSASPHTEHNLPFLCDYLGFDGMRCLRKASGLHKSAATKLRRPMQVRSAICQRRGGQW